MKQKPHGKDWSGMFVIKNERISTLSYLMSVSNASEIGHVREFTVEMRGFLG